MSTLTGQKPKDTYKGLIKTSNNSEVTTEVQLSDGDGNLIPIKVSTTGVDISGVATANGEVLKSFVHDQTTATTEWTIGHNMNKNPSVTVVDSANRVVIGEVEYLDKNALVVRFKYGFKGKAYLN